MTTEPARIFLPNRRKGVLLHTGIMLVLSAASIAMFATAFQQVQRVLFIVFLLVGLALLLPMPLIVYRLAALLRANYQISRDGLLIRWGAAHEDIPLDMVEWVRPYSYQYAHEGLPFFSVPGAILGSRPNPTYGRIDYFASEKSNILLVGLQGRALAVSPGDMTGFLSEFQRCIELGSLHPLTPRSTRVGVVFTSAWADRRLRLLISTALLLSLILLGAVAFIIPISQTVPLGIQSPGQPFERSPSDRLLLLPVLSLIFFAVDVSLGLYLRREAARKEAAELVLISASILPILFLLLLAWLLLFPR